MFENAILRTKWFIAMPKTYSCFKLARVASKAHIVYVTSFMDKYEDTKNDKFTREHHRSHYDARVRRDKEALDEAIRRCYDDIIFKKLLKKIATKSSYLESVIKTVMFARHSSRRPANEYLHIDDMVIRIRGLSVFMKMLLDSGSVNADTAARMIKSPTTRHAILVSCLNKEFLSFSTRYEKEITRGESI